MKDDLLNHFNIQGFQENLIAWYQANKRNLPWRENQDPYRVWVSEIMLQQTKVDTVIPYFQRFMEKFPDVYRLASADEQDVLKAWEGLGYYSRARNLQSAVREVVSEYDGKIPDNKEALGKLKGIGPYTKGAILSIAFQQPEPAVDGNVMRVLSRVLHITDNIAEAKVKKQFEPIVTKMISKEDPSSFNQGLMELGAMVCTPKSPLCLFCPVQEYCRAFLKGDQENLPIKSKAKKPKKVAYIALLLKQGKEKIIIEKRKEQGLLANLWQFPMIPSKGKTVHEAEEWFEAKYGWAIQIGKHAGKLKHVFTHLIWELEIYEADVLYAPKKSKLKSVNIHELSQYPFPVSHQKMMKYLH
ncbi:A/G-specific adenine glycosylase [Virgibacillus sp. 179-BFC.A HS]|uniref:Adenine DNA glycosylase n=1 Tax=Tigheibacillus jepli TaxID=3035914 RepID=A0ABU5CKJ6_9BACI|nr:A/G-specific adenine glycosylase [Virgibacillus sp. 179-BFC.A HS]MDY0406879.1 A/G-specific adenine glycosylase [Virgibacillus sp. 179-BFC.A HS]